MSRCLTAVCESGAWRAAGCPGAPPPPFSGVGAWRRPICLRLYSRVPQCEIRKIDVNYHIGFSCPLPVRVHRGVRPPLFAHPRMQRARPSPTVRLLRPPLQPRTHRTPGCAYLQRRGLGAARSTSADAFNVRSSSLSANMVSKSRNTFADALFTQGPMALVPPTIQCDGGDGQRASL